MGGRDHHFAALMIMNISLPLILASASPRRLELLRRIVPDFTVVVSQAPEDQPEHLSPMESAQLIARRKALAVARANPHALVIGADTVVCLGRTVYGKPKHPDHARQMLFELQGRIHEVITGVCLMQWRPHREVLFADITRVAFKPLTGPEIDDYLSRINPLDKAGAYAIQEFGDMIIADIEGSFDNVVGLPTEKVVQALQKWAIGRFDHS